MELPRVVTEFARVNNRILSHRDLRVYQAAAALRKEIFRLSLDFPPDEKYELRSQSRRASRSVCATIGEAWRKRHYPAAWVNKLSDAEQEAGEMQVWVETAAECEYITNEIGERLFREYDHVIAQLVLMGSQPEKWAARKT